MKMLHHNLIVQNPLCCHFLSPPTLNTLHETQLAPRYTLRQLHPVMVSLSIHRRAWLIPLNIHDEIFIILQSPPTDSTIKITKKPCLENGSSSRQLSIFRSAGRDSKQCYGIRPRARRRPSFLIGLRKPGSATGSATSPATDINFLEPHCRSSLCMSFSIRPGESISASNSGLEPDLRGFRWSSAYSSISVAETSV